MTTLEKPSPRSGRAIAVALSVSVALVWSTQSGTLLRLTPLGDMASSVRYLNAVLSVTSDILVMLILVVLTARLAIKPLIDLTGIKAPPGRPLLWAALLFLPALAICHFVVPVADDLTLVDAFWQNLGFPVGEEFFYRGLAVGILMRISGWPFLAASLWPAVFFGLVHAWQGSDLESLLGIVAITALGGLIFGWLFVRWDFNLWPAILLHVGLNALWFTYDLGTDAIGGWFGNALRLVIILCAIGTTFWLAPHRERLPGD